MAAPSRTAMVPERGTRRRYTLNPIPREHIDAVWPLVHPYTKSQSNSKRLCKTGSAVLFFAYDAEENRVVGSCLGEIILDGDDTLVASVFAMGGERFPEWAFLIQYIEEWARLNGAAFMEIEKPRKGYQKFLPDYATDGDVIRKRLA